MYGVPRALCLSPTYQRFHFAHSVARSTVYLHFVCCESVSLCMCVWPAISCLYFGRTSKWRCVLFVVRCVSETVSVAPRAITKKKIVLLTTRRKSKKEGKQSSSKFGDDIDANAVYCVCQPVWLWPKMQPCITYRMLSSHDKTFAQCSNETKHTKNSQNASVWCWIVSSSI